MKDHHVNVFYNEEDGGYIADIPNLKYCSAFGKTAGEALREIEKAKQLWLETARDLGKRIPRPGRGPVIYRVASQEC